MLCVRLYVYSSQAVAIQMAALVYVCARVFFSFDIGLSWARMRSRMSFFLLFQMFIRRKKQEKKKVSENGFLCLYHFIIYIAIFHFWPNHFTLTRLDVFGELKTKNRNQNRSTLIFGKVYVVHKQVIWSHMIMIDGQTLSYTDVSNHFLN